MAELALPFLRRIIRESLFEWVQRKQLVPIDRIFKEVSSRERLGPREREACGRAIYEIVRHWNDFLPRNFDPQTASHLHHFEKVLGDVLQKDSLGSKQHLQSKPKFEDDPAQHLRKFHPIPDFLFLEMQRSPEGLRAWHDYLHASRERAPVFLRLNQSLNAEDTTAACEELRKLGAEESPFVDGCYRFQRHPALNQSPLIQKGWAEIQDEHSQLAAHILQPKKNEKILDLCAGAGGKTLHLADMLQNEGEVFAYDSDAKRLATLLPRAQRGGWKNIKILKEMPREQKFDTIVIDAPCSGLGTLRRSPDRLFSFSQAEAERLRSVQTNLLLNAKKLLQPHGKILYITCTPRPQENLMILLPLFEQGKLSPLNLHSYLRNAEGIRGEKILSKSRQTSSSEIAHRYSPTPEKSPASECYLALGPEGADQASDALQGDSFFYALVQ